MDTVLYDFLGSEVFCYVDDIISCTGTKEHHFELLREVCDRLRKSGLRLKAKKWVIMQNKVAFVGHEIDEKGVHMSPEKMDVVPGTQKCERTSYNLGNGFLL